MAFLRNFPLLLLLPVSVFSGEYIWRPFQSVVRPEVPGSIDEWGQNPIDAFVSAQHFSHGLKPRPEVSKEVWLRRVHIDLIGLNPTPKDRADFLADESSDAYGKVVDKLLADPAYGERWGRHWMDIWRYSDWAGYKKELRDSQRHIWHWRDWIVEALNEDKGYDQMIREMLAADELYPENPKALRATGYLARNYFKNRNQWMDNVVTHTSQGFLGLTLGCAKCHDHMYDEFSMEDYYAFRAIFEPYQVRTDQVPGELDVMKLGMPRAFDASITAKTYMFENGDERIPLKDKAIPPGVPALFNTKLKLQDVHMPKMAYQPHRRPFVVEQLLQQAKNQVKEAKTCLEKEAARKGLEALEATLAMEKMEDTVKKDSKDWEDAAKSLVLLQRESKLAAAKAKLESTQHSKTKAEAAYAKAEEGKSQADIAKAKRTMVSATNSWKSAKKALATAQKLINSEPSTKYTPRTGKSYPNRSSGRRTAFANWLVHQENPLTARVAVNHIWLRHFDQAIVPTVNEFGSFGNPPSHPALLDWLAVEFMESGWSMKRLHKLIVLSATYRTASTSDGGNAAIDPDNVYFWRMPTRRMEGEIIRDNLLHIGGTLDRKMGGPDIPNTEAQKSKRRSIYMRHAHEKLVEFVQIFDGPKVTECYQRDMTVQPHQALALANSRLTFGQSKVLAGKLAEQCGNDDQELVDQSFIRILSRMPNCEERSHCLEFLERGNSHQNLVMVLFNHNDFITIR